LPTSADALRERYVRLQAEVGDQVTIVVATKYVSLDEMAILVDAGVSVVGENRAQDLAAKHVQYGSAFAGTSSGTSEPEGADGERELRACHSLDSESAAARLTIPALVEVNP
jgi:uncharacterized pyridoxal phosphate-containing UPF0001 family protein